MQFILILILVFISYKIFCEMETVKDHHRMLITYYLPNYVKVLALLLIFYMK